MSVQAVVFDWGGTLTPWHDIDVEAESVALAAAAVGAGSDAAQLLRAANETVWGRSRDEQRSATVADLFAEAGLDHDPDLLAAYREFWEPHTLTDPEVAPLFRALRERGLKVGVLSNTVWPRAWHEQLFERDGVLDLIDGAVYTSEVQWTKPAPEAFAAALESVAVRDPGEAVFVGDRLFDDVWGAQNAGLRAIHVPHSTIPAAQVGHSVGEPDAVVQSLIEVLDVVDEWCR